ncbi:ABC transporter permease [Bdellovibrio sp. HCB337]|uniref:ABC transporter permease n=1 Tax=Bdellovibrio sp. HCB337 TaxID=3394358 RepID=UPI0039A4119D
MLSVSVETLTGFAFDFQNTENILQTPNALHWFGTDSLGRDVFTRVFYGARVSLFVALFSSLITMVVGICVGALAGWFGGYPERILIRSVDVLQAIPSFLLVSLLCLFLQSILEIGDFNIKTLISLAVSISLVHWFNVAKVTRGQTKQIKVLSYIEAARALGATPFRIFIRHVLPNMQGTLLVLFALQIPASILYESMISFAGYGLQSPQVSWGILLQEGWRSLSQFPHLLLLPALVLFLTVLSFHLILFRRRKVDL